MRNVSQKTQQISEPSNHNGSNLLIQRKCSCGGPSRLSGDCESCDKEKMVGLQPKLRVGATNDTFEQEADRVADQVMNLSQASAIASSPVKIQRLPGASPGTSDGSTTSHVDRVIAGNGNPLEGPVRQDMERRFGHDFSQVRIHTGSEADRSARHINARAYTVGNNIVMANGQYIPQSSRGRHLLAHELTHTIQQSDGGTNTIQRETWNDDEQNCTSTANYLVQLIFDDNGADTWTPARKTTYRNDYKRVVEDAFNVNTFRIKPLTESVGTDACPCNSTGFSPQLNIDLVPDGESSVSEDLEIDVAANSSGAFITSSQNTLIGYGDSDEADNTPVTKSGSAPGVTQIPSVHEFGHFLGLHHPGEGLEGTWPFSSSRLSPGANEYTHTGTDEHGRTVDGPNDLMGVGMGLRPFYFNGWLQHISGRYNRFCGYRII